MTTAMDAATDFDSFQNLYSLLLYMYISEKKNGRKEESNANPNENIYNSMRVHKEKQLHVY